MGQQVLSLLKVENGGHGCMWYKLGLAVVVTMCMWVQEGGAETLAPSPGAFPACVATLRRRAEGRLGSPHAHVGAFGRSARYVSLL